MNGEWPTLNELVTFSLLSLSSIFFTVDPIASIPAFLAMGAGGSRERNREIALQKLVELLRKAAHRPKRRIATKPTRASKTRRLDSKSKHAQTKRLRRSRPDTD